MNKKNGILLYTQVANVLRKEIAGGKYREGESIGTQDELSKRFGVSSITVRKAILLLSEEGFVETRQGKGTFAKSVGIDSSARNLNDIQEMMSSHHLASSTVLTKFEVIDTPDRFDVEVKKALGRRCLFFRKVLSAEGSETIVDNTYVPEKYAKLISREDIEKGTMYSLLRNRFGIVWDRAAQIVGFADSEDEVKKTLGVPEKTALMVVRRKSYDDTGKLIVYFECFSDSRLYVVTMDLDISSEGL